MGTNQEHCKPTEQDIDNGWSPRLRVCYNCCLNRMCSSVCGDHSLPLCSSERCTNGNIIEFELKPIYPATDNQFYCSVRPVPQQLLAQMQFDIQRNNHTIHSGNLRVMAGSEWTSYAQASIQNDLLQVEIDSHVQQFPDVIKGDLSDGVMTPGVYRHTGVEITNPTSRDHLILHPKHPFVLLHHDWSRVSCDDDILRNFISAEMLGEPYLNLPKLRAKHVKRNTFAVMNITAAPTVNIRIPRSMSVLAAAFHWTAVYHKTLTGNVVHTGQAWNITITGHVLHCPGVFSLNISDGGYPTIPLFTYDVAVKCPRNFVVAFTLPTGDSASTKRDFIITVRDASQIIQLVLQKAENLGRKVKNSKTPNLKGKKDIEINHHDDTVYSFPVSVPFLAAVCGAVVLLLFMIIFGIVMDNGLPDADKVSELHCRHGTMATSYITCQVIYSLIFSLTTFVMVWIAINSDTLSFLQHYDQPIVLQKTLNSLEFDRMHSHLMKEFQRQTAIANETKSKCHNNIKQLVSSLHKMEQGLYKSQKKRSYWEDIKATVRNHTKHVLSEYTKELLKFRDDWNRFSKHEMDRLVFNIEKTFTSLPDNRWLRGPKYIRDTVENLRTLHAMGDTKPLMDWLGINIDWSKFRKGIDTTMPMPPLPDINDVISEKMIWNSPAQDAPRPPTKHIYNYWFTQTKDELASNIYSLPENNGTNLRKLDTNSNNVMFYTFVITMVLIDLLWFAHRLVKACRVGMMMLHGFPWYVDCRREPKDAGASCCNCDKRKPKHSIPRLMHKLVRSQFLPKAVVTGAVVLIIYVTLALKQLYVNQATLSSIGYYNDIEGLIDINERAINERIETNAQRINDFEYKSFESVLNAYLKRHTMLLELQGQQLSETVGQPQPTVHVVNGHSCRFRRIEPILYHRRSNAESLLLKEHSDPMIEASGRLITNTCTLVLVYLAIVVIKELLDVVVWLYVKRSGVVRLRVIYETDQEPIIQEATDAT